MEKFFDVIVVGAGAAGLACAKALCESQLDVAILEARHRIGGRCLSVLPEGEDTPIELGAEFMHGRAPATLRLLEEYRLPYLEVTDHHLVLKGHDLKPENDYFERVGEIVEKLNGEGRPDRSIAEFLEKSTLSADDRRLFQAFVEGFHAADVNRMSEKALARSEDSDEEDMRQFRLAHGYTQLMDFLARDIHHRGVELHLNTTLKTVCWENGRVELRCRDEACDEPVKYITRQIVVTLPLGVLQAPANDAAGVEWRPRPPELRDFCDAQVMGQVHRLVLKFQTRFWESLDDREVSFLHTGAECYFPTWWCLQPTHRPFLTAWQGGPRATEMSTWTHQQKIETALETLSRLSGQSLPYLHDQLVESYSHDWTQDPFSRGAYSYIKVDGVEAACALKDGLSNTIFFAGEALCQGSLRASVHGAIESGLIAARQVLRTQVSLAA